MRRSRIDYGRLVETALRTVVRDVLLRLAKEGAPPPHHFYVTFRTRHPGVVIPEFLRDRFRCVYCGNHRELTFDHVIPRAQGGRTTWENVATACAPCNLRKGGRTPRQAGMHIEREPIRPTSWQLQDHGRSFPPNYLHQSWRDYLYWDVELEA